jgi:outer membrane murein-binding lipoprotein Lpp
MTRKKKSSEPLFVEVPRVTRSQLASKLNPNVLKVSPKFTAMLAYFLDERWADPRIVGMTVTSDGILLVGTARDPMMNEIAGEVSDLDRNLAGVSKAVDLTQAETKALKAFAYAKITDWRTKAWA